MARSSARRFAANVASGTNGDVAVEAKVTRCAIYTRKSTEEGLRQEFNSLDAQWEAAEAYIASQKGEGWQVIADNFDDGGYSGGNMDRPALTRLLAAVESGLVDCVVVYKVDRLSRSLMDFARIIEVFDQNGASFVSVNRGCRAVRVSSGRTWRRPLDTTQELVWTELIWLSRFSNCRRTWTRSTR